MTLAHVPQGTLRGVAEQGIYFFGGVPYAADPVGPLRFRPPAPPPSWDGERPATAPGPAAPQVSCYGAVGEVFGTVLPQDEACLTLTIRTPDLGSARLPVLVWLHGGGFVLGSGGEPLYQSGAFARDGVIEVSVTHRLGVDGYATVGPAANLGLRDQLAALTWVRENIHLFGGDPGRITLAGHSAGAMAVACLLASPLAQGMVAGAIVQSATAPLAVPLATAARIGHHLADALAIPREDLTALAAVPRARLLEAQRVLCDDAFQGRDLERYGEAAAAGMAFVPVWGDELLPQEPLAALAAGAARDVPLLAGTTRQETLLMMAHAVGSRMPPPEVGALVLDAVTAELGRPAPEPQGRSAFELAVELTTEAGFRRPTLAVAEAHAPHAEVFTYLFDGPDPVHGAELRHVFGSGEVHDAWVAFAAKGRPPFTTSTVLGGTP
ncbi:carboxylesterase family protein [Nonomuraea sp. NPDC049152]|uniref:carboxylesterase family protein n=1 Tax=Nonomuraea sp. NPDC049152 TaxID=3154350 RepID=UPI0033D7D674